MLEEDPYVHMGTGRQFPNADESLGHCRIWSGEVVSGVVGAFTDAKGLRDADRE
jgi:hypothetical protein